MTLPKFLWGDNSDFQDAIFIIHTEYPRFIINLVNDEIQWLEDLPQENTDDLTLEMTRLIEEAGSFYDREIAKIQASEK